MEERKALENGCRLSLSDAESNGELHFTVNRYIDGGGNALAYEVTQGTSEIGRLKEFFPYGIEHLHRMEDGPDLVTEELSEAEARQFELRKREFEAVLEKRKELRGFSLEIGNTMPEFCQLLFGNNTLYLFQSYRHGLCYKHVTGETLEEIFKTAIGLTKALKCYHDSNFVHLDVKPENMLVCSDNAAIPVVQLFDIDTVTNLDDLHLGRIHHEIPHTPHYAASEHEQQNYRKIDASTDIHSVGVLVFQRIMGRFPDGRRNEKAIGAFYNYDRRNHLFQGAAPLVERELTELFRHTIMTAQSARYKNGTALLEQLKRVLAFTQKKTGIIQGTAHESYLPEFYGRTEEFRQLDGLLKKNNLVLLYGMGGIGKSEFIKQYIHLNSSIYKKVIYIAETKDNIQGAVLSDDNVKIDGLTRPQGVSAEEYFRNKLDCIKEEYEELHSRGNQLILVFDNTEYFSDISALKLVREIGCPCVVVSRDSFQGLLFCERMELGPIKEEEELLRMMRSYLKDALSDEDEKAVRKIIAYYDGHPLTLEMMAKTMKRSRKTPAEVLEELEQKGVLAAGEEAVPHMEGCQITQKTIDEVIVGILDVQKLSQEEQAILQLLALLPADGMTIAVFKDAAKRFDFLKMYAINSLCDNGIVKENGKRFQIHPVIREIVYKRFPISEVTAEKYKELVKQRLSSEELKKMPAEDTAQYVAIGQKLMELHGSRDVSFLNTVANACQRLGRLEYTIPYLQQALQIVRETQPESSAEIAALNTRLGHAFRSAGNYSKSREQLTVSVKEYRSALTAKDISSVLTGIGMGASIGGVRGAVVASLMETGLLFAKKKKEQKALEEAERAKREYDSQLNLAKAYNELALLCCEQGEYTEAYQNAEEAYRIAEKQAGTYRRAKTKWYYFCDTLGKISYATEQYKEAEQYFRQALELKKDLEEPDSVYFYPSYYGIARCCYERGDYETAEIYFLQAMELCEARKGLGNPDTADIHHAIAKNYAMKGNTQEAEMYFRQAISSYKRILGQDDMRTLQAEVDYANVRCSLDREVEECRVFYREKTTKIQKLTVVQNRTYLEVCRGMLRLAHILKEEAGEWSLRELDYQKKHNQKK